MKNLQERFDAKYIPEPMSGCWLWTSHVNEDGYGRFSLGGKAKHAHRISWILNKGDIPQAMHVLHRCDNPCCVNPDHLFLGTHADNMKDRDAKGRANRKPPRKLTSEQAAEIKKSSEGSSTLARRYAVSAQTIWRIRSGVLWRHLS